MAESVHLRHRADPSGIAEVIRISAACEARAGRGFHRYDPVIRLAAQLLTHKRGNEAAEVGTAACAADDHVRLDAVFIAGRLCLKSDNGLVQKHLVQHAAKFIAVTRCGCGDFHRL